MKEFDIVLLTEDRFDQPAVVTEYIMNLLKEDEILAEALNACGLKVTRKSWSDPAFDWSSATYAMFRTTWDYFTRFSEFERWMQITQHKTTFINPLSIVKWNLDKHYLADLKDRGIRIVETIFIEPGDQIPLAEHCRRIGHTQLILKPAISGAARHTYRLDESTFASHEQIFRELIAEQSMLLQPFQNNIIDHGEVAFMVIGGKFTHAVLKKVKPGDFRVQDDFGGTLHDYQPSPEEIEFAEKAVSVCSPQPLYARVDVVTDNNHLPAIMELELIEPEMWFRRNPSAANALAARIKKLF